MKQLRFAKPLLLLLAIGWSLPTMAQGVEATTETAAPAGSIWSGLSVMELFLLGMGAVVLIAAAATLIRLVFTLMELQKIRLLQQYSPEVLKEVGIEVTGLKESWWSRQYKKWTGTIPIEKEADIMLDHDYDGVRELDNDLPPWWLAIFYLSTAFAVGYIYVVHFTDYGISSSEQYVQEMEMAEADVKAYLATQSNAVDETNVVLLSEADALSSGQLLYVSKCAVCHGQAGEGGIGPNLTDEYWLHGGSIGDVFKTIKYGVPEKGMVPWKNDLRPRQMQEVASYIKSLQGTDPPNAKEPQGEPYEEELAVPAESEEDSSLSMNQ